jgi:hypothetical protein
LRPVEVEFRRKLRKDAEGHRHWLGTWEHDRPIFTVRGVSRNARRSLWEMERGVVPLGMEVEQLCGVRECIAPEHAQCADLAQIVSRRRRAQRPRTGGIQIKRAQRARATALRDAVVEAAERKLAEEEG